MTIFGSIKQGAAFAADRVADFEYSLAAKAECKKAVLADNARRLIPDNKGMAVVEIVLIIAVVIGVLFLFREKIGDLITSIFEDVDGKKNEFLESPA